MKVIRVEPITLGRNIVSDVDAVVAKAYLAAAQHLPKDCVFTVWGSCSFGITFHVHTRVYTSYKKSKLSLTDASTKTDKKDE